jgi:hypothetical protein
VRGKPGNYLLHKELAALRVRNGYALEVARCLLPSIPRQLQTRKRTIEPLQGSKEVVQHRGIDLVARLAVALDVPVADLLPTSPLADDLAATRKHAKKLFDELLESKDRAVLLVLTQVLARLAEATNR